MNELGTCICGKELKTNEFYCSERCRWIAEKLNTPFGQSMDNLSKAVRFFGKQYDKRQGK